MSAWSQGVNQLELGLNMRTPSNATKIMAMAHSHGIKIMFSVVSASILLCFMCRESGSAFCLRSPATPSLCAT